MAEAEDDTERPAQAQLGKTAGAGPSLSRLATATSPSLRDRVDQGHPYLTSRLTSRAGRLTGAAKVGMVGSVLATLGLGFLRRRGKEKRGAALLATAAGLALLRRRD